MTKTELETKMTGLINKLDPIISSLKSIKNYRLDSMCTDFLRSLTNKRAEIYYDWEKLLNYPQDKFSEFDIDKYCMEKEKQIFGFSQTLEYLQARKPIHNPY